MTVPTARLVVSLHVSDHVAILNSDQTAPSKLLALITPYGLSPPHPAVLRI